jgi:putative ABC transport system permease protein
MFQIALRNLFQEKTRFLISIGGVAFSVVLIMVLTGLYQGWKSKIGEYIRIIPADIWVMQNGSEELFHTPSILPITIKNQLQQINGVETAKPFNARRVALHVNGHELNLYVVADEPTAGVGQPAKVVEGKATPDVGEIIVDKSQSRKVKIGDVLPVAGQQLKVVGFSEGGDLVTSSFAFAQKADIDKIQKLPNSANFFLVTVKAGANIDQVIGAIKSKLPATDAVSRAKFVDNNTKIITDTFLPVILVLLVIGVVVGISVIGLTIFTSTLEKSREYGVLKAIGMRNAQLYGLVIQQALIAGVVGFGVGMGITLVLQNTLGTLVPQFVSQLSLRDISLIFGVTIVMAMIAAYIPVHRISRIDPAEVFKA